MELLQIIQLALLCLIFILSFMTFIIKANTTDLDRFSKELSEIQDEMRSLRAEMIETSKYVYNLNMELDKIKKKLEE